MNLASTDILQLRGVCCARGSAAIREVSLDFSPGTITLLLPGAGSDLLLRILSLQERPDAGEVWLRGQPVHELSPPQLAAARTQAFGFVLSSPCLLPALNLAENVAMPAYRILGNDDEKVIRSTDAVLEFVGLRDRAADEVTELDLSEQQRLSLARALVHSPRVLVLDRPEHSLERGEAAAFRGLVERACREFDLCVVAAFHPTNGHYRAARILAVGDGTVSEQFIPVQS